MHYLCHFKKNFLRGVFIAGTVLGRMVGEGGGWELGTLGSRSIDAGYSSAPQPGWAQCVLKEARACSLAPLRMAIKSKLI